MNISIGQKNKGISLTLVAWAAALLVSLLPDILFRELSSSLPAWLFWAKVGLSSAFLISSLVVTHFRPLRQFFMVLLVVQLLEWGVNQFYQSLSYASWLTRANPFVRSLAAVQIPRLTSSILLVMIMLVIFRQFGKFFLVKGKLDATAAPIPLITSKPSNWRILGPVIAGAMCVGLVVFTLAFGSLPTLKSLRIALPLLPWVPVFALVNSFGEEMLYRAPWLGALESPVGAVQALLITAVFFGVGHFYGVPYGIAGVILAFIPGWLIGKSMLETRGFTWAWFIHFCMDVTVFFFIALGSVTPGG